MHFDVTDVTSHKKEIQNRKSEREAFATSLSRSLSNLPIICLRPMSAAEALCFLTDQLDALFEHINGNISLLFGHH